MKQVDCPVCQAVLDLADPYPEELFPSHQDNPYVKGWRAAMATAKDRILAEHEPDDCTCGHPTREWNARLKDWFCAGCGGRLAEMVQQGVGP